LIRINNRTVLLSNLPPRSSKEEIGMPFDAILLSLAVTVVFVGFAVALAWADSRTRSPQIHDPAPKRRSF